MKKLFNMLVLLLLVLSLVGCKKENDKIKIGTLGPYTGNLATYGNSVKNGVMLAVEEINANGGILGKQVEFLSEDDQGKSDQVLTAYNKIVDEIDFLVGEVTSGGSEIVAAQANQDGIPMLAPAATSATVTMNREYVFRTCFLDPDQGIAMAKFTAQTLKLKTVAICYDQSNDYSKGVAEAYKEYALKNGINVLMFDGGLKEKQETYSSLVSSIVSLNPECVFAPVYYEDAAVFAKELRAAGFNLPLLGADGFDGILGQLEGTSDFSSVNNTFFSSHYSVEDENVKHFFKAYKDKFGEDPAVFAALAYDSVYIAKAAMEKAGTTDKKAVRDALAALDFKGGITGDIKFDENGDPIKTICICEYVNGKMTLKEKLQK